MANVTRDSRINTLPPSEHLGRGRSSEREARGRVHYDGKDGGSLADEIKRRTCPDWRFRRSNDWLLSINSRPSKLSPAFDYYLESGRSFTGRDQPNLAPLRSERHN
jgi:hypothetical protein